MGPYHEFVAHGRDEIRNVALGYFMEGFEDWKYPYHDVIIDDQRGTIIGFYKQVSPYSRRCGCDTNNKKQNNSTNEKYYQVEGVSGSWFEYAGNYQFRWQKDFFDMGNVLALTYEMAGKGRLSNDKIRTKIRCNARGLHALPLVRTLRTPPTLLQRIRSILALIRIVLFG